ncbi:MAG: hypothetical protein ACR2FV_07550 [Ornithinimicrobium sp.]|uniref:hypothetical protein n=1 Tax=Ornithinimicrobium sp. TaxID=1977084 RepID=UPI003D9B46A0
MIETWGGGVFAVQQSSEPAIEAPLGWVLSDASRQDMRESLAQDIECGRAPQTSACARRADAVP